MNVVANAVEVAEPMEEEWTYDPNEPRYCICNQVSYGDMVACDNQDVSNRSSKKKKWCQIPKHNDLRYIHDLPLFFFIRLHFTQHYHQHHIFGKTKTGFTSKTFGLIMAGCVIVFRFIWQISKYPPHTRIP